MDFIFYQLIKGLDHPFFRPLHMCIQTLERSILGPLSFAYILRNQPARVFYRHSILEKNYFHFLLSDLDASVVFDEEISLSRLEEIKKRYEKMKILFPFLGEVEIYSSDEYQELLSLSEFSSIYSWLRKLRKLVWIDQSVAKTPALWRQFKARRARRITLEKMKISMSSWLWLHFSSELGSLQKKDWAQKVKGRPPIWSDYLGYWINSTEMAGELPRLVLAPEEIILLCSILPDQFVSASWLPQLCVGVRAEYASVRKVWHRNVQFELLHLKAWKRNLLQSSEWNQNWIQILSDWKKALDNKLQV